MHKLERIVSSQESDLQDFLVELEKPAEAYKRECRLHHGRITRTLNMPRSVNLLDVRKGLNELKEDLKKVSDDLRANFSDELDNIDSHDKYPSKMSRFLLHATGLVESLNDRFTLAETTYSSVVKKYGEDESISTSDFFGVIATFVATYKVSMLLCASNISIQEAD